MQKNNLRPESFVKDYIHILPTSDGKFSIYVTNNGTIRRYGVFSSQKEALKRANSIQERRRLQIVIHDTEGNVIEKKIPKLVLARSLGDVSRKRRTSKKRKPLSIKYV